MKRTAIRHRPDGGRLYPVRGGLLLDGCKQAAEQPILNLPLPATLVLPLVNYKRELLRPLVRPGESVAGGQQVAAGVLAGTSGRVCAIEDRPFLHPSGGRVPCVVIQVDGRDEIRRLPPQPQLTLERLLEAGVQGMGGAGFAAADKLRALASRQVSLLIINAAECEPGIACDAGLIQAEPAAVVDGIRQLAALTGCQRCCIAIEETSQQSIASLQAVLDATPTPPAELQAIPARYPSGAEPVLIRLLSGRQLRAGERPTDHGIVCVNVATAYACGQAGSGTPLHSRITTLGGDALPQARNVRVRFGTPVAHLLQHVGPPIADAGGGLPYLRAGGPLSGFAVDSADVSVTATTHCVTLNQPHPAARTRACIRCGQCADACPAELLPQQLYRYARSDNARQLQRFALHDCIACGCCDLVCPSAIPLTATFRHAQSQQRERAHQEQEAARLAAVNTARDSRLQQQAEEREAARARRRQQLASGADPIAAALARARQKRRSPPPSDSSS